MTSMGLPTCPPLAMEPPVGPMLKYARSPVGLDGKNSHTLTAWRPVAFLRCRSRPRFLHRNRRLLSRRGRSDTSPRVQEFTPLNNDSPRGRLPSPPGVREEGGEGRREWRRPLSPSEGVGGITQQVNKDGDMCWYCCNKLP